ncbi:MAG: DciA family protein [Betaproteobacteria bacterium]|nr:DciA family protein [Betaproteobacteria bacterium]
MSAKRLSDLFNGSANLSALVAAARRLDEANRTLRAVVPDLAPFCRIGHVTAEAIVIFAASGGVAARLRQQLPTLQRQMEGRGLRAGALRVEVRLDKPRAALAQRPPHTLTPHAVAALRTLAATLPASSLKQALESMIGHHGDGATPGEP